MKTRRFSSNAFNKRKMKTSDRRKNMESKSTTKRRGAKNRSSNSNSRKLSLKRNLNSNYKKRGANRQSGVITIKEIKRKERKVRYGTYGSDCQQVRRAIHYGQRYFQKDSKESKK